MIYVVLFPLFDCVYIDIIVYFLLVCHKMTFYIYIKRIYHSIYSIKLSCFLFFKNQTGFLACVKFLNISCVYKLTGWQSWTLPVSNSDAVLLQSHVFSIPIVFICHASFVFRVAKRRTFLETFHGKLIWEFLTYYNLENFHGNYGN